MKLLLGTIAILSSLGARAECVAPPTPPEPPDGMAASREEMLTAQGVIKAYNTAVVAFQECVQKNGGSSAKVDAAVRQLQRLADRFNAELRTFKQKNGG